MKKFICLIMAIIMVVAFSVVGVNAADYYTMGGGGSSTVTYTQQSRYMVMIPETIDMDMGSYTFTAAEMNILPDEYVAISMTNLDVNGNLRLYHESDQTIYMDVLVQPDYGSADLGSLTNFPNRGVAYFEEGELTSEMNFSIQPDMNNSYKAGEYSGTAEFLVELLEQ